MDISFFNNSFFPAMRKHELFYDGCFAVSCKCINCWALSPLFQQNLYPTYMYISFQNKDLAMFWLYFVVVFPLPFAFGSGGMYIS